MKRMKKTLAMAVLSGAVTSSVANPLPWTFDVCQTNRAPVASATVAAGCNVLIPVPVAVSSASVMPTFDARYCVFSWSPVLARIIPLGLSLSIR